MTVGRIGLGLRVPPAGRAGDPGLFGPHSLVWRIARERILLTAGPAALLLQIAHPLVAEAVAGHSRFRQDPFQRLRATLDATLTISFGDADQARAAASQVAAVHRSVRGRIEREIGPFEKGTRYDAADPELGLWVHTTLVWMALDAYQLLVAPLSDSERAGYYQESKSFARQFGVTDGVLPASYADFLTYREAMIQGSSLAVGDVARGLAAEILRPGVPAPFAIALVPLRSFAAGALPDTVRDAFGLRWGRREQWTFRSVTRSARSGVRMLPAPVRYWPHYRAAVRRVREVSAAPKPGRRSRQGGRSADRRRPAG